MAVAALSVNVHRTATNDDVPDDDFLQRAAATAAEAAASDEAGFSGPSEVAISIVAADESQALNAQWRDKDKPTNVLSFPAELPAQLASNAMAAEASELDELPFGDLALCWPVVEAEAAAQGKRVLDHCAHLVVHGLLHLAGYDHEDDTEAAAMEALEVAVLAKLSIADPYLEEVS